MAAQGCRSPLYTSLSDTTGRTGSYYVIRYLHCPCLALVIVFGVLLLLFLFNLVSLSFARTSVLTTRHGATAAAIAAASHARPSLDATSRIAHWLEQRRAN
eukprot:6203154-Pleurochrysis_carterae.AAC.1